MLSKSTRLSELINAIKMYNLLLLEGLGVKLNFQVGETFVPVSGEINRGAVNCVHPCK